MKNNKIIYFIFITVLLGTITSCSKKLDSLRPKDAILQEALTENDIVLLRNGVYNKMEDAIFSAWFDFDKRSGNFAAGPGFSLIDPINMSPLSSDVTGIWQSTYRTLAQVNFFIESIDKLGSNTSAKVLSYKGEALFFRAQLYYILVTRWGGVPIITKRTYDIVQRSSEADSWAQIVSDLKEAQTITNAYSNSYYVSTPAVHALLAKAYLAQKQYDSVINYASKVIASGKFSQATDSASYAAMFVASSTSKEHIFALSNNTTNSLHLFYQNVNDVDATWDYSPDPTLYNKLYADSTIGAANMKNDKRKTAVFFSNNTRITKFPNGKTGQQLPTISTTNNANATPIPVLRYSDIILALAEAQSLSVNSTISNAATTLNTYFINRYKTPPSQSTIAALNATDFQNLILNERRREFFGEGQWWYDVKRTNRLDLFTNLANRTYLLLYPIPQDEKDLAGYTQNPGY